MNINRTLLDETYVEVQGKHGSWTDDLLSKYGCSRGEIEHFLTHRQPFLVRQQEAIKIIDGILTYHGKQELLTYVTELARVEHGIQELEPWVRDHVVHALLSFVLGIYLNEHFLKPNACAGVFQWKLAGLLHDVGYPIQIAKDILKPFSDKINEIKRNLDVPAPDIGFKIVPTDIEKLSKKKNSLTLIQNCIDLWDLDIDVNREYHNTIETNEVCHGMISSISVLYVLDLMYKKYNPKRKYVDTFSPNSNINWNQIYFDNDIIPACSAIFVHNLPPRCFATAKICREKAPLAFLLRLADCLQDWERPSMDNETGFPATQYDIRVDNDSLIFSTNIPDHRKDKIRNDVLSCLIASDISIV